MHAEQRVHPIDLVRLPGQFLLAHIIRLFSNDAEPTEIAFASVTRVVLLLFL